MCIVSAVGDNWRDINWPSYPKPSPVPTPVEKIVLIPSGVTKQEFDELKKEVEALKNLLIEAKKFDEATGQPDCEMDDKVALIKAVAEKLGVDMSEVFK